MAHATFKITISAKDQASGTLKQVKGAITGMIGAWLGYKAISEVTKFIGDSVKASAKQETALAKVEAALKSTGNAVGMTIEELAGMADQMQKTTALADDAVLGAQALGLTFTAIGKDIFPDFIKASADMSQAMGTDMRSAILQLGKAIQDPERGVAALARVGINTYELQEKMTDAMPIMEKQRLIIEEINTEFGGMAEAMGATLQGRMTRMGNMFGDMQEKIGNAIVGSKAWGEALANIEGKIEEFGSWFEENEGVIEDFTNAALTAFQGIANGLVWLFKATANFMAGWKELWGGEMRQSIKDQEKAVEHAHKMQAIYKEQLEKNIITKDEYIERMDAVKTILQSTTTELNVGTIPAFKDLEKAMEDAGEASRQIVSLLPEMAKPTKEFRGFIEEYMIAPIQDVELAVDSMALSQLKAFERMRHVMHSFTQSWASSVIDSIWAGEADFGRFVRSFISGMTKMIAKMLIFKAISTAFGMPTFGIPFGMGGVAPRKLQHGGVVLGGAPYTDRIPSWLTPEEGVVNLLGMKILGREGLDALNRGNTIHNAIDFHITLGAGSGVEQGEQVVAILEREFPRIYHDAIQRRKI